MALPDGLYDLLLTEGLARSLAVIDPSSADTLALKGSAAELLADAITRQLATILDDVSGDDADKARLVTGNDVRARLVVNEWLRLTSEARRSLAIVFCVSVAHAEFMTDRLNRVNLPAACARAEDVYRARTGQARSGWTALTGSGRRGSLP